MTTRVRSTTAGHGPPTVVLEAGFPGGSSLDWHFVVPLVAGTTTVFAYDRPGIGGSPPDPAPRSVEFLTKTLERELAEQRLPGPFVLVGHSGGGLLVRAFQRANPNLVCGLVLVDASHEQQIAAIPEAGPALARMRSRLKTRMRLAGAGVLGLVPLVAGDRALAPARRRLPHEVKRAVACMESRRTYLASALLEVDGVRAVMNAVAAEPRGLGSLPLAVVSADRDRPPAWARLQADLASLSARSTHRILAGIGHDAHLEAPEEVAAAIRDVVSEARSRL